MSQSPSFIFAGLILNAWYDGDMGDFDGSDIQEFAEKAGLIKPEIVTAPCSPEGCKCVEYGEFPMECYRLTSAGKAAAANASRLGRTK